MMGRNANVFILWLGLYSAVHAFHLGGWQRRFLRQQVKPIASILTKGEVSSAKWIDSVFGEMQPSHMLIQRTNLPNNSDEDTQCIIDYPSTTLANPLLGVDLDLISKKVLHTACKLPGCRTKPLMVTVRGTGGGKTRLLEEIRRNLQRNHSVLPIAISFNTHNSFDKVEFAVSSGSVSAALSIIARMASAFYGKPFSSVEDAISDALPRRQSKLKATDLYTAFVQLMRQQMQDAGCSVETFVLMIDETVRFQSQLLEEYPLNGDPLSDLRNVLLNQMHNAALVLSSLEIEIKGIFHPGRPVTPLLLCEALDPGEIVTRWWNITDSELQHRFKLFAAVLCDLPRAVELTNTYIQTHCADIAQPSFAAELVQAVKMSIEDRYSLAENAIEFPFPPLLKAMLFKSAYPVDAEVTQSIRESLLTNVLNSEIKRVSMKKVMPVLFSPRLNLFLLASRTGDSRSFSGRFLELLRHILHTTLQCTDETEDLLRMHTALMLNARVGVCMYSGSTVTLAELLGLNPTGLNCPLRTEIRLTAKMASMWTGKVRKLKYRSNKQASEFLEEIEAIEVCAEMPIALRYSATGDNFGILMKVYDDAAPAKCQYVVLEVTPEQETSTNVKKRNARVNKDFFDNHTIAPKEFPERGKLAKKVCTVMAQLNASTTYVYCTTHDVEQAEYKPPLQPSVMWVYGGREETQKFMGPLWDLHRTYREGLLNPSSSDQKKE